MLTQFRPKLISLSSTQSMAVKMLSDREKFGLAKTKGDIELLLELMQSDE